MEKAKYPMCRNMLNSSGKYNLQNQLNNLGAGSRWSVLLLLEDSEKGVYGKDRNGKMKDGNAHGCRVISETLSAGSVDKCY